MRLPVGEAAAGGCGAELRRGILMGVGRRTRIATRGWVSVAAAGLVGLGCALVGDYDYGDYDLVTDAGEADTGGPVDGAGETGGRSGAGAVAESSGGTSATGGESPPTGGRTGTGGDGTGGESPPTGGRTGTGGDGNACDAWTCSSVGAECGQIDNGCGELQDCGVCPDGSYCGTERPNRCSDQPCLPATSCAELDAECGSVPNCQTTLDCGVCDEGERCQFDWESDSVSTRCVCDPITCAERGAECGPLDNGCGKTIQCGTCDAPAVCDENENACCTPRTCASVDAECGELPDQCGGVIDCGRCPEGETCSTDFQCGTETFECPSEACAPGGSDEECCLELESCSWTTVCGRQGSIDCSLYLTCDTAERCDAWQEVPEYGGGNVARCRCYDDQRRTCAGEGAECGTIEDGCGNEVDCGATCPGQGEVCHLNKCCLPATCQGEGVDYCGTRNLGCGVTDYDCGSCAEPFGCQSGVCVCHATTSCEAEGAECGVIFDGCETVTCPDQCTGQEACDGTQCVCQPLTECPGAYECGTIPDGCDTGTVSCGAACEDGLTCVENMCECVPITTECDATYECGVILDECGNEISCGTCEAGYECNESTHECECVTEPLACPEGAECGTAENGCGETLDCGGDCAENQQCTANVCECVEAAPTCPEGAECGSVSNTCGETVDCGGECPSGESCNETTLQCEPI